MRRCATGFEGPMLDLVLGGATAFGLLIYLIWALVRPEDF
jgi:K+-transporting ATPase KdpF subunit